MNVMDIYALVPRRVARATRHRVVFVEALAPVASPGLSGHVRHCSGKSLDQAWVSGVMALQLRSDLRNLWDRQSRNSSSV